MKQKRFIAALSAALVLGFGGAVAQAADNFTGPYVGGSLSLFNSTTIKENGVLTDLIDFDTPGDRVDSKLGADDTFNQLDILFGYGMLLENRVFLGAEARYTLADNFKDVAIRAVQGGDRGTVSIEGDGGYALMFQAGYAVANNVVLYGTAGHLKRKLSLVGVEDGGEPVKERFNVSGLGYGIGLRYALNRNFLMNAEVIKAVFSRKTEGDSSLKPDSVSASVGIIYRF